MVLGHVCDNNFGAILRFLVRLTYRPRTTKKVKSIHKDGILPVKSRINKLSLRPFTIWSHVTQEGNGGLKKPDVFFLINFFYLTAISTLYPSSTCKYCSNKFLRFTCIKWNRGFVICNVTGLMGELALPTKRFY